ncbi:sensor domain-containing protein [Deinococcus multiflagellatus]|uniref:sensor domain-containing protein n=1 Tax=Deinococcus multiflagellatus TaxID=1656887 RepID=UPI001CCE55F6|nr:EAL domain-containing protein [Deinococcus multiflagellatus]MBZ9715190.1 EAL domain-containing protein [Deinococcus multiflagellatus]
MSPAATFSAVQTALSDLLRVHAPQAVLLAQLGEEVLRVQAHGPAEPSGPDLVPPDEWFDRGEMTWLTRDGALLGLLWTDAGQLVPDAAVQVLTMLLAAARLDGQGRETEVMVTQLPVATAWLTGELLVRKVSRPFLELFELSEAEVTGRSVQDIFADRPAWLGALAQAGAGRSVRLPDEQVTRTGETFWMRGEARPYYGAASAGVMLTLQDVSGEYERAARVAALLDTDTPAALLSDSGAVLQASHGLKELLPAAAAPATGAPLWVWPCFADVPSEPVRDLVRLAATGGAARAEVELASGGSLALSVRRTSEPGLLVAQGEAGAQGGRAPLGVMNQVLSLSEDATILVDHAGRAQLVSERAATLLGVEAARLVGLAVSRVMSELGVRLFTPAGEPMALPDWKEVPLPLRQEILLALPDGTVRQMELRVTGVGGEAGGSRGSVLLTLRDLTALRRAQAKIRHDARHDSLTGLLNRTGLREALGGAAPATQGQTVVCLDLDGFTELNAALGRTACDRLLIQVAARLNDLAAETQGQAARLADDSFALSLPGLGAPGALARVEAALEVPLRAGSRDVAITAALGVATTQPGQPGDAALTDAEVALQHAKRQGRSQRSVFDPALRAQVARAFELEEALRGALDKDQFTLLYQPAVSLRTGRALSAEALLRWNHPTLGMLSPNAFLDLASRSELIAHISEWVVQEAVLGRQSVRGALGKRFEEWAVSVNLSLEELRRAAGLRRLLPLLSAEGAPDIEVAAGSLLDHSQETLALLEQLRSLGARLSVDDFGEGETSLSALTRFPLSAVKLHPSLTARLPGDEKSVTLVQATIDLAHRLGLQVVAVGVEHQAQLDMLRDLGCDAAQGYAITPPLPASELVEWLREH